MNGTRGARRAVGLAAVAIGVLAAGACGGTSATSSRAGDAASVAPAAPGAAGKASGATGSPADAAASAKGASADGQPASFNAPADGGDPQAGRSVISSATLTVKVDNVGPAKDRAADAAQGAGGYVFGEQTTFGQKSTSVLTLKVPPAAFRPLLDELGHLGVLDAQDVKTDDVTQQVVDLQARITATEASLERTRALLGQAKSITELSQLENEVVRRQSDLESLRGQQKTLQAKVDLATITLTLSGDADATPAKQQEQEQRRLDEERRRNEAKALPGFFDGLSGGLTVAAGLASVAAAALGALLPFLPLALAAYVIVRLVRRASRRAAGRAAAATAGADPGDRSTGG